MKNADHGRMEKAPDEIENEDAEELAQKRLETDRIRREETAAREALFNVRDLMRILILDKMDAEKVMKNFRAIKRDGDDWVGESALRRWLGSPRPTWTGPLRFLQPWEARARLGVSDRELRLLVAEGQIACARVRWRGQTRRYRYSEQDVMEIVRERNKNDG